MIGTGETGTASGGDTTALGLGAGIRVCRLGALGLGGWLADVVRELLGAGLVAADPVGAAVGETPSAAEAFTTPAPAPASGRAVLRS